MPSLKKLIYIFLSILALFFITACGKPSPYPKNPDYSIKKPKVAYKPHKKNLVKMVKKLNGSPYVWAEEGPNNFDCSGYTYYMYGSMGIELPRVAREQAKAGQHIEPDQLQFGDLIFFDTTKKQNGNITHVGMYLGDGWFTHASTTKYEVVYSNLHASKYYKERLRVCRRYLPGQNSQTQIAGSLPWKTKLLNVPVASTSVPPPVTLAVGKTEPSINPTQSALQGRYYVQVGSFTGKPKSALLHKITSNGYKYKMIQFPKNGTQISKLLIGPYKEKATALKALPSVKANIEKAAFIAEIL